MGIDDAMRSTDQDLQEKVARDLPNIYPRDVHLRAEVFAHQLFLVIAPRKVTSKLIKLYLRLH